MAGSRHLQQAAAAAAGGAAAAAASGGAGTVPATGGLLFSTKAKKLCY